MRCDDKMTLKANKRGAQGNGNGHAHAEDGIVDVSRVAAQKNAKIPDYDEDAKSTTPKEVAAELHQESVVTTEGLPEEKLVRTLCATLGGKHEEIANVMLSEISKAKTALNQDEFQKFVGLFATYRVALTLYTDSDLVSELATIVHAGFRTDANNDVVTGEVVDIICNKTNDLLKQNNADKSAIKQWLMALSNTASTVNRVDNMKFIVMAKNVQDAIVVLHEAESTGGLAERLVLGTVVRALVSTDEVDLSEQKVQGETLIMQTLHNAIAERGQQNKRFMHTQNQIPLMRKLINASEDTQTTLLVNGAIVTISNRIDYTQGSTQPLVADSMYSALVQLEPATATAIILNVAPVVTKVNAEQLLTKVTEIVLVSLGVALNKKPPTEQLRPVLTDEEILRVANPQPTNEEPAVQDVPQKKASLLRDGQPIRMPMKPRNGDERASK